MRQAAPIIKDILKHKRRGTVLDLGSGTGRHSLFLARNGFRVTAVDIVGSRLAELRRAAREGGFCVKTRHADLATLRLTEAYDVVVATMSLHFLPWRDIPRLIRLMRRHTRPGGLNIISAYTAENEPGTRPYLFGRHELRRLYSDWRILHYQEALGPRFRPRGAAKPVRRHRAVLMAQLPALKESRRRTRRSDPRRIASRGPS